MGPTPSCHRVTWQGPVVAWGLFLSHSVRNRKGSASPGLVAPTLLSVGKQQMAGRCVWQNSDSQSAGWVRLSGCRRLVLL